MSMPSPACFGCARMRCAKQKVQVTPLEAFQHFACLYIKYMQIFRKLEECYHGMVHPQKRIDVKLVLTRVMAHVVQLKLQLVKWNPPNPDLAPPGSKGPSFPFPWEYVNLDDILVDLKLPPETLEVPVPRYFVEDRANEIRNRDKVGLVPWVCRGTMALPRMLHADLVACAPQLIKGYMNLKLSVDRVHVEEDKDLAAAGGDMSLAAAIQVIQRNERGRQGKARAVLMKELREEEKQRRYARTPVLVYSGRHSLTACGHVLLRRMYDMSATSTTDKDPEIAASNIQKVYRGYTSRRRAARARDEELVFIGMKPAPSDNSEELELALRQAQAKRKTEQLENKEAYEKALVGLHDTVLEEEGPEVREKLTQDRRNWFTEELGKGKFPDNLEGYYAMLNVRSPRQAAVRRCWLR